MIPGMTYGGSSVFILTLPLRLAVALSMLGIAAAAHSQSYPSKPVHVVVTVPAGGSIDTIARAVATELAKALGQPVVVENRAGANGNIAAEHVARAAPDGHTMLVTGGGTMGINTHVFKSIPFDPIKSFAPVTLTARTNLVLVVHPKLNVARLREFLALARANPGKLNYGSSGSGSQPHLAGEILNHEAGVHLTHVPYKGLAPATSDLLAGQIDLMFDSAGTVPHVKSGKLRALAVVGPNRLAALPDVATFRDLGLPAMEVASGWHGAFLPANTPREIVQRLNAEVVKILRTEALRDLVLRIGAEPAHSTPEELAALLREDVERMGAVVKRAGITPQ
jgi:tripartite-type tricarboxylate transporter receptor subunit TctC